MQDALPRDETQLVERLRDGDESAFVALVRAYGAGMLKVARMYVSSGAVAEEVVQEAWLGVVKGIDRFEGRSSLKTWLFHIVANTAKTRGARESRSAPFSSFGDDELGPTVAAERFRGERERFAGHWAVLPTAWAGIPEERLFASETMDIIRREIERLPPPQRAVITLRDIEGLSADDVCSALDLTEANGRVLLHRARAKVRAALEEYLS